MRTLNLDFEDLQGVSNNALKITLSKAHTQSFQLHQLSHFFQSATDPSVFVASD